MEIQDSTPSPPPPAPPPPPPPPPSPPPPHYTFNSSVDYDDLPIMGFYEHEHHFFLWYYVITYHIGTFSFVKEFMLKEV